MTVVQTKRDTGVQKVKAWSGVSSNFSNVMILFGAFEGEATLAKSR